MPRRPFRGTPLNGSGGRARLARLAAVDDPDLDLAATGLALSDPDRPAAELQDYFPHIEALADDLRGEAGQRWQALGSVMGRRFAGDDGEAAEPGLARVIDTRRGSGEALGILALEAARRAGWRADGLAFPARFLLRLEDGAGRVILDPAGGWRAVEAPELRAMHKRQSGAAAELAPAHWTALGNRDILVRLQNAAKHRLLRQGRLAEALAAVEATLLFAPSQTTLWREAGLMHLRLGRVAEAVAALEQFARRTGNATARRRTLDLLHQLRGRLN